MTTFAPAVVMAWSCLLSLGVAEDAPVVAAALPAGYAFTAGGDATEYLYTLDQDVSWRSAGEELKYQTKLQWKFSLRPAEVGAKAVVLKVLILGVHAEHHGPGSDRVVDSASKRGANDPLLGHFIALEGALLTLTMDPATGLVSQVAGGEKIIAAINAAAPGVSADQPGPLDAAARAAYSPQALAIWWSQLLALPSATPQQVPLLAPLSGSIVRAWEGTRFTLALPEGVTGIDAELLQGQTPLSVRLSALKGRGSVTASKGLPALVDGELTFALDATALTQPVTQQHRLSWHLRPLTAE